MQNMVSIIIFYQIVGIMISYILCKLSYILSKLSYIVFKESSTIPYRFQIMILYAINLIMLTFWCSDNYHLSYNLKLIVSLFHVFGFSLDILIIMLNLCSVDRFNPLNHEILSSVVLTIFNLLIMWFF
jgi:hypothetical protein